MNRAFRLSASSACLAAACLAVAFSGCLDRTVVSSAPTTSTTFTAALTQTAIDKVDLLVVIDNSASMGDKQAYLRAAVPDLVTRLVTPNCLLNGSIVGKSDAAGNCSSGTVEFPPVHDMHVGLLSTSLGERLANTYMQATTTTTMCVPDQTISVAGTTLSKHNDDRAELVNRAGPTEQPLADLGTSGFLNYFPDVPANAGAQPSPGAPAIRAAAQLEADFQAMVQGVGTYGCAIESQLESWYRFLVQPDPYDSLELDANQRAQWVGVDTTILKQRHDFLRPDSLVAILDLTDEDDSEVDVRALGGQGYLWMNSNFEPPRATSGCAENASLTGLADFATCNSCSLAAGAGSDPSCAMGGYGTGTDWGFNLNLRHVHEEQKYGVAPQFPIQRYVLGLTSTRIPDRTGEYPAGAQSYQGLRNLNCTNPLFAKSLPDGTSADPAALCNLPVGTRSPSLVYYAHIGGVPHQLLQARPGDAADAGGGVACPAGTPAAECPQKDTLSPADWQKILGNIPQGYAASSEVNPGPRAYDYSGIDPHMIESFQPRPGLAAPPTSLPSANPDPISGYEWITDQGSQHVLSVDREYACIFPLTTPRDCSDTTDPSVGYTCDCPSQAGLTAEQLPPLCDPRNQTSQIAAKAYPTIRELLLANLLGTQGIVSSLCPIHVTPANGDSPPDPLYGYRPAMTAIADRLRNALTAECLPEKLQVQSDGTVPCVVLVTLPRAGDESVCNSTPGMSVPAASVLTEFRQRQEQGWSAASGTPDPATLPVCQLDELTAGADPADFSGGSCASSTQPGWCYVTGPAAGSCEQSILFARDTPPSGALVSLQCLEQAASVVDASAGGN
jgi:hypothetical protein